MATNNRTTGPQLACEITQDRIIAARVTNDGTALDSFTSRAMAVGAVVPRLADDNVENAEALRQAISDALTTVGTRSKEVAVILPDAAVRIALLEFDTLPEKKDEAAGVIRFRLKKALPFDVDKAAISYDVVRSDGKVRVLVAVVLARVLAEYEQIFRDLGLTPGVVVPSSLAALGNVDSGDPVMVIKSDANTTTLAIVGNGQLLLFRTLDNPGGVPPSGEILVEDVHASLVFFQDTYNMTVNRILVGGWIEADNVRQELESHTNIRVHDLVSSEHLGSARSNFPASNLAAVVGALLG
jgi:type IV pilus assembly protein PilM